MKNIVTFLLFVFTLNGLAQSPWTQKKGKMYTQLSFSTVPSYNTIYGNPDYTIPRKTSDNTIQIYGEYGVSDKTSLIVSVPFKVVLLKPNAVIDFTDHKSTFGNIEIGIKHNFSNKKWLISGQFNAEINTSTYHNVSGIRTGYDAWSFTPLFIIGKSTEKTYLQLFTGITYRTNKYSSNFKIGGEFGWKFGKKFWFATFIDVVKSFDNGTIVLPSANLTTALYVNNQEYGGFGFKGIYEFSDSFGITAGLGGAFFANNVAKQAALNVGIYKKF